MEKNNESVEMSESLREVLTELNKPETGEAIKELLKNAKTLAGILAGIEGFLKRGEEIADNVGESLREFSPQMNGKSAKLMEEVPELVSNLPVLARTGNKITKLVQREEFDELLKPEKLEVIRKLSEKLEKKETLEAIGEIVENAETIAFLTKGLKEFLGRGEEIADNIGEAIREFKPQMSEKYAEEMGRLMEELPKAIPGITKNLPAILEKTPILMKTTAKLGEIAESEGVEAFLNSGMLTPELVGFLGEIGKVTVKTEEEFRRKPEKVSIWGMYGAMKDEDVQRGVGFMIALAGNIGKMLKK